MDTLDYNTRDMETLAHKAFESITNILRDVVIRIDNNQCKDSLDVVQPYMDKDQYDELRIQYDNIIKQQELEKQQQEQEEQEEEEEEDQDYLLTTKNTHGYAPNTKLIQMKAAKQIVKKPAFWKLKGSLDSSVTAASTYTGSNSSSSSTGGEERTSRKKKQSAPGGLPLNWGLLVGMLSNVSLDQIKSMANLLIMIISRTPVKVLLTQITGARLILSSVYDLLYAVYRRDVKDIGISILYVLVSVISFKGKLVRNDKILKAVLYTSKYLRGVGNKKKVNPAGFVYFLSFVSYLLRLVNPPNITLLDIALLVKDQVSAKL
ncbi:hypothetical protein CYY_002051 [Polysphondylium violaceum]|uniref:Uncharacterized protein n=1 Tax=Polysphondylium violaceum TaxID=133409 RepID=A0A8J4V793_9MYCE|nr:hypothetical protein CYY_002051 [Polysphondylium violaceum]